MEFPIAGVQVPAFLLIFAGFTVGLVGGFIGVGGGYMMTPALVVFGFPGYMAAGTDMTHIAGKGVIATIRHRALGNVDWKLGLTMVAGTQLGVELGVRLLSHFKNIGLSTVAVLSASLFVMAGLFVYVQIETRRAHAMLQEEIKIGRAPRRDVLTSRIPRLVQRIPLQPMIRCPTARVTVSLWVILLIGIGTGALAGFLGVGGGFVRVPALIYLLGVPSHIAVGTDLLEIVFSGGYGALRHSMDGNVDFVAVLLMLSGAAAGAQLGSIITGYVRGPAIRYILGYSLILATAGSALRLVSVLTTGRIPFLQPLAMILTLGEMVFLCLFILSIFYFALRHNKGKWIPEWAVPLVVRREEISARAVAAERQLEEVA